ncbi:cation/H(+) antiporter 15-like [Nymphaea colorata]|nr:cation/H(+) antiporter 15-like [Nymphaea colorata]
MNNSSFLICDDLGKVTSNGLFAGERPFHFYLPRLTFQLTVLSLVTLAAQVAMKPMGQTRYVANLIAGVLIGPTCLTHIIPGVTKFLFPQNGPPLLELVLHFGLCFWYFLMGAQLHPGPMLKNVSAKAALIGMTSMLSPLLLSYPVVIIVNKLVPEHMQSGVAPWFMGFYFLPTTVTVLAGNVIDHELLGTDVGNLATTAAIFTSIAVVLPLNVLLLVITPKREDEMFYQFPLGKFLSGIGFAAFSFFVARPVISWIARRIPSEEDVKENHVCGVLLWAVGSAAATEVLGCRITYGAFLAGFVLPHSALTTVVTKRLEDFNTTLLMPPFFAVVGLNTNLLSVMNGGKGITLAFIILLIYVGKVGLVALAASSSNISTNEGLMMGVLMSSRGILDILMLFWASTRGIARTGDEEFATLVLGIIVLNMMIGPAISYLYERPMVLLHKGCRAVQELRPDMELRILACLYDHHTIPSLLSLVKATNATKFSPIYLSALHLVHATSRESTVQQQSLESGGFVRGGDTGSLNAAFMMHKWPAWVNFNLQTKLSSYSTMPEHICKAAESGRATLVIIPFHIRRLLGSHTGVSNEIVRNINLNVLEKAPCSVAVLVDMGIAGARTNVFFNVAVLFFGGPHDREAMSYALRMADVEGLRLTLVRFTPASGASTKPLPVSGEMTEDDIFIARFRTMFEARRSVTYMEKEVGCGADTVTVIQGMDKTHDLFIVGRHHRGAAAQMLAGLDTWSEYPELGTAGDLLVSPDVSAPAVLVVQQYSWGEDAEEETRESRHGIGHGGQTYRGYVLHDQVRASAPAPGRGSNVVSQHAVQFDEYGWNWNLRAGF